MNLKKVMADKLAPMAKSKAERESRPFCIMFSHQPKIPQKLLNSEKEM